MMSDFDDDFDTNRTCPLCGAHAPARQLEDRSLYEFEKHGNCGHFLVSYANITRVALESDEQRERYRRQVAEANERGIIPLLQ